MSSKSRPKQQNSKILSASDEEIKYRRKYKELKKKIHEMEEENDKINLKLVRAKKSIQRLKIERSFLVDRLEQSQQHINNESGSEISSSPPRAMDTDDELNSVGSDDNKNKNNDDSSSYNKNMSSQEEMLEDSRVGKRKKQVRDPNAPKRPRNAFLIYCQNQREQAKEENQNNKGFQGVTRILSQKWKDLPEDERKIYFEMYNKEKLRYEKEMSSYVGASSINNYGPEDSQRNQNVSIMMMGEDDVNTNNVINNVTEHSIDYDDQANTERQPISSSNIHNHYNSQEEKYRDGADACATESEDNEMFDELAADIAYNRGFTRDVLRYNENENEVRGLGAEEDEDEDEDDEDEEDEDEELGSVEGGGDLEYDRRDVHNMMSENED
ncbi:20380_t:CDS:2 [Entrophospora sp. SA101]|nr:5222_t:CDS:2 [Entrophospora sp. SA101]CAJ0627420.1 4462_t:CDS:2 [Entrophospora sp. SA101]CAJ0627426.1 4466_t:CDS:2 [Entrophospora sp. SA101]CAJ0757519.1 20380_t:CDS:2 [Entrophospora sp. SA101]CAJ0825739.1 8632_t:CDS:2 [Entrophospora sp. SA101]